MNTKTKMLWSHVNGVDESNGCVIDLKNGDRMVLSYEELVRACRIADRGQTFMTQFKELVARVNVWLDERNSKVDRAYLSLCSDGIDFTVVQTSAGFDREFNKDLVELDVEIAKSDYFDLIKFHVMSLPYSPEETVRSFVKFNGTLRRQVQESNAS